LYDGEWKNGKKEGKGKRYNNDGSVFEGEYENDQPKKGIYIWEKDKNYYKGEFLNGLFHGEGTRVMM
jgi:hypothetical protein